MKYKVTWETDEPVELPEVVEVPEGVDDIANWLSDEYGWLVNGLEAVK